MDKAKHNTEQTKISVAPMMDWTDRHCRYFHRLLAPTVLLYTEMVTTGALIHGDKDLHLDFDSAEQPLALQLGGSEPQDLATCTKLGEDWGYQEINLNCGCPSDRVQKGRFGACLMKEPEYVEACVKSMIEATSLPVTVKCRIGVDECEDKQFLYDFVSKVAESGCKTFIIHARKAWLKGLSPKENRTKPPLNYDLVLQLKQDFPELEIILNGEINSLKKIKQYANNIDGFMIGREAYQNPWFLAEIENHLFGTPFPDMDKIIAQMSTYLQEQCSKDDKTRPRHITRHMTGLFKGLYGGKIWRQSLATLPESNDMLTQAYDIYRQIHENKLKESQDVA